eukprot:1157629-Pelagomonas_calceolata.AAC.4
MGSKFNCLMAGNPSASPLARTCEGVLWENPSRHHQEKRDNLSTGNDFCELFSNSFHVCNGTHDMHCLARLQAPVVDTSLCPCLQMCRCVTCSALPGACCQAYTGDVKCLARYMHLQYSHGTHCLASGAGASGELQAVPVVGFGLHLPPTEEQQRVLDEHHERAQGRRKELAKETMMKGMQ